MPRVKARSPEPRPRSLRAGAYVLPSFFTVANVFCGYFALTEDLPRRANGSPLI